jgi:hypothetical protein
MVEREAADLAGDACEIEAQAWWNVNRVIRGSKILGGL